MKDLDPLVLNSQEGAKEKKQNPEEMNEDNDISKDLKEHCQLLVYHRKAFFQGKAW
jgi:hypothetical protein